jgi:hypothetical protein
VRENCRSRRRSLERKAVVAKNSRLVGKSELTEWTSDGHVGGAPKLPDAAV